MSLRQSLDPLLGDDSRLPLSRVGAAGMIAPSMDRELPTAVSTLASKTDEAGYADRLIRRIVEQSPRRLAGSAE